MINLTPSQLKLLSELQNIHPARRRKLSLTLLAVRLSVSEPTVRRGAKRLMNEGLIVISRERPGQMYDWQLVGETA